MFQSCRYFRLLLLAAMPLFILLPQAGFTQVFTTSLLAGETSFNPTSLQWGPDQKLYVLEVTGDIKVYTISRSGPNNYQVTSTQTISLVKNIQNHNDDGTIFVGNEIRQATGLLVSGTASSPVIYVTSSDYRVGGGWPSNMGDVNLDTNSGIISRLTKSGSAWTKVDLVRGLPRSEENHATNGLALDEENNILYVAQGGNTNGGAPSQAFTYICETALSAAILRIDLNMIDTMPVLTDTSSGTAYVYNLPTVDDPTRPNANGIDDPMDPDYDGVDIHDPFGGNDGLNQARLVEGGPVQIHASGFRNAYDLVITRLGKMYAWDNGPNFFWGGYPVPDGYGIATNNYPVGEPGSSTMNDIDCLHDITDAGYYAGHPNPIRGNPDSAGIYTYGTSGVWRTEYLPSNPDSSLPYDWPPLPLSMANPIEGDFQAAGEDNTFMYAIFKKSMNGICEYTASHFDGAMSGDLLTTGFNDSRVYRIRLDENGELLHPDSVTVLASSLTGMPLDVAVLGDEPPFPGTIWVIGHISTGPIHVLEPSEFFPCTGEYSYEIDEDGDFYSNADEIDNGVNPCNPSDKPADFDMTFIGDFLVSNLNDPDDDDDGIPDTTDFFVWDAMNGLNTTLPLEYPLLNSDPGFGFYGLGFTGLMMNGHTDYLELWRHEDNSSTIIVAGGAVGRLTIVAIDTGDALGSLNTQTNAFQFGVPVDSAGLPILVEAVVSGPVFPDTALGYQSAGMFIGTGDQDNYVKIVINANGGDPGIEVVVENDGVPAHTQYNIPGIGSESGVRLGLLVNPVNGFVRAQYSTMPGPLIDLGDGFYVEGDFLQALKGPQAIAAGVIATARGSTSQFSATWDHISVQYMPETSGQWYETQDGTACQSTGPGPCCYARHECGFVQSGDKFYLLGGREQSSNVNIYDPVTDTWSVGAAPGMSLHHFQAVDYHGLIIAAGAFTGSFPEESNVAAMRVYNPVTNTWHVGPTIPFARRRGAAGAVIRNDTLYLVGGTTNGHLFGTVNWLDAYDLREDTWTTLPNAPKLRDHFHAAVADDKIYAAAGRRTSLFHVDSLWLSTEPRVDVFDIPSGTWNTLDEVLPTQRGGTTVAVLGDELIVIGGEREEGPAKNTTEALSLTSHTWRTLDSLHTGRHGTQAIVNNGGIYIASGAPERGGNSSTRTAEAFYFYGETEPVLTSTVASALTGPGEDFGEVPIMEEEDRTVYIYNTDGNQAILLHSMSLQSGTMFTLTSPVTFPRFLKPGDSLQIEIRFAPIAIQAYSDSLVFQHTGSNGPTTKFALDGDGVYNWLGSTRAYVDSSATASSELGHTWEEAFKTLTRALQVSGQFPQITEVWIAKGSYFPGTERGTSFTLRDSLHIFGGFHGSEILLSQRDINTYRVVLSGDIGTPGDSSDNVYHVVVMTGTADTAVLDGVIIRDGTADGVSGLDQQGAGVFNLGKLTIRNAEIRACTSVGPGSAILNSGISAMLQLQNVLFAGNSDPHVVNKENATLIWSEAENVILDE